MNKINAYERCYNALKKYFEKFPEDGEEDFYIIVKEYAPFNWNNMYKVKVEWISKDDFNCIFDSDYDEGQEIDIIKIFPEHEVEYILTEIAWRKGIIYE